MAKTEPKRGGSSGYTRARGNSGGGAGEGGSGGGKTGGGGNGVLDSVSPSDSQRAFAELAGNSMVSAKLSRTGEKSLERGVTATMSAGTLTLKSQRDGWDYHVDVTMTDKQGKTTTKRFQESSKAKTREAATDYARKQIPSGKGKKLTSPDELSTSYRYTNAFGNPLRFVEKQGKQYVFEYGNEGRYTRKTWSEMKREKVSVLTHLG